MADRGPVRVVPALRAHDIVDLLLHQLVQHTEPDADAQREQPLLRCPDQLAQRLLHALREHGLLHGRLSDRYVALTAVPPSIFAGSPRHAPKRSGRGRRDRRHLKVLRAPGQPRFGSSLGSDRDRRARLPEG